ncbi:hypothetical protein [Streptomyces sp. 184]|uniref:hypothetical protein n=1 Tax=Streptomyces sp. 184 TaxID=1827526 RepID=UPI00389278BA
MGSLEAEHLTVLDGRTLNVCVPLPAGGAGRPGAWLRVGERALRLEVAGARAFGTYVVEPVERGGGGGGGGRRWSGPRRRAAGAGHGFEVIAVAAGERRELGVEFSVGGRRRRRSYGLRVPGGAVPGGAAAGPTRLDPPHPGGWRVTVTASEDGGGGGGAAVLGVERLAPHAEVDRVEVGWTELAIRGRVVGLAAPGPASGSAPGRWAVGVPARRRSGRGPGAAVHGMAGVAGEPAGGAAAAGPGAAAGDAPRAGVRPHGGEFACELVARGEPGAVCGLRVAECGGGRFAAVAGSGELARLAEWRGERTWEVRVRSGGCAVPVGRLLGDLADPGRVHRLPNRLLVADSGDVVRIAPHYTAAGRLVVVTEVVGGAR